MRPVRWLIVACGAALVLAGAPAWPQTDATSFEVGLAGGLGGALDADPGSGLDATTLQLRFSWVTDLHTKLAIRAGTLDFGADEQLELLTDAELQYLTIAGEYHFRDRFYDSALFLGLGYYELSGLRDGVDASDSNVGFFLGALGDFPLTRRLSFTIELSGHYAEVERVQLFLLGHAGLSFHF